MIKRINVGEEKFEYPLFLFEYLHSYLFRFCISHDLFNAKETLEVPLRLLPSFKSYMETGLSDLLLNHYIEPSQKQRSKGGSKYQKIPFRGKVFIVDFRTDPFGNTSYGIYMLLIWIKKKMTEHSIEEE